MAPPDPIEWFIPVSFHFSVSIGKQPVSFSEVKGIDFTLETESVISGGDSFTKYYLPKGKKYNDLILSRGILKTGDDFFKWCNDTLSSPPKKDYIKLKNLLVALLDECGQPIKTWIFKQAYPVQWSLSDFGAMKNEVVVETVHIRYNSFFIQQG
jgi:phage tail-like protein